MKRVRCAIYTRKSSEEGLEQDFNSLDAQREACAAYVLSQASEGWTLLPEIYDDGGISGGTLERPALQRLLADVAGGRIDTIVVYKVDRLTRSLLDFSKLVEAFDAAGTSFVSVTQSFNTTTSMGRLTLNMLLSFAQFEREVTAERIRDKIAASKAKGMWMGGTPPLGYRPDGRSLAIVEEHAAIVRDIFARYIATGNVRLVAEQLAREGIGAPVRTRIGSGKAFGGVVFTRGQIHAFLKCPAYVSEVHHNGHVYPALHTAIIDRATWDAVQHRLDTHVRGERRAARAASPSLLAGLIVDAAGVPLIATHACKGKVRYRYYVSRAVHHGGGDNEAGVRIPALEIETAVARTISRAFDDPLALAATLGLIVRPADIHPLTKRSVDVARHAAKSDRAVLRAMIARVRIHDDAVEIDLATAAVAAHLQLSAGSEALAVTTLHSALRLTRTGGAVRLVQANGCAPAAVVDVSLIGLVIKARRWWGVLREGELGLVELAAKERISSSYLTRVLRLAFLSPAVVDAILAGALRTGVSARTVTLDTIIPACWQQQRMLLLPAA
ncbi:recombinase family protein [Sphingomonas sp. SUN019]|uniref:recombinase family protein n=1 Tax=Sphingomonas sp. SUN019 TaxID=2937788 RepID=UPI002164EDA4|nr:recombinase family protein [Sphingomonas sp. SUN019]UVO50187.1 recombinase family protein [Sphingomonas sp. SUN019]